MCRTPFVVPTLFALLCLSFAEPPHTTPSVAQARDDARSAGVAALAAREFTAGLGLAEPQAPPTVTWVDPGPWNQRDPAAAADSSGNLYLVWQDSREGAARPHIRFAYRGTDGSWRASEKLDPGGSRAQTHPAIAIDGSGNAYAIWEDERRGATQIYFAYRAAGGRWEAAEAISPGPRAQSRATLAVNRRGEAAAAWVQGEGAAADVYYSVRPVGGSWGTAQTKTAKSGDFNHLAIALDDWGRVYLTWADLSRKRVLFAQRSPTGVWSPDEDIRDTTVGWIYGTRIAVDSIGNVHAVWEDTRSGGSQIYAAYRPVGGPWSVNVRLDGGRGDMWSPGLAIDGAGNAIAAWSKEMGDVYGAAFDGGNGWRPSQVLISGRIRTTDNDGRTPNPAGREREKQSSRAGLRWQRILQESSGGSDDPVPVFVPPWYFSFFRFVNGANHNIGLFEWDPFSAEPPPGHTGSNGWHVCCDGPQPPVNADGAASPPEPPGTWRLGIVKKEVDGQTVFVVQAENGRQGIFSDKGDAERFAMQNVVPQAPAPPEAGPVGPPAAGGPPPAREPVVQTPNEPAFAVTFGDDPLARALQSSQRQMRLAQLLAWAGAGGSLTPQEQLELNELRGAAGQTGQQILDLYFRALKYPDLAPSSPGALAGMTPNGYVELVNRVAQEEAKERQAQRQAEEDARRRALADRSMAPEGRRPGVMETIADYRQREMDLGDLHRITQAMAAQRERLEGDTRQFEELKQRDPFAAGHEFKLQETVGIQAQYYQGQTGVLRVYGGYETEELADPNARVRFEDPSNPARKADPVLPHSGEFVHSETLLVIPGRGLDYQFSLTYRSQLAYHGPVGYGWQHNYDRRIVAAGGGSLALQDGAGLTAILSFDGEDFTPSAGRFTQVRNTPTGILLTHRTGLVEEYYRLDGTALSGRLRALSDRNGNALRFGYDGQGRLQTVTDTLGRTITYAYDADGRLATVTDFAGRSVALSYDAGGDLVAITTPVVKGTPNGNDFPEGKTTRFTYTSGLEAEPLNHNLTAIISPNEVADGSLTPRTVNTYGTSGAEFDRVVQQSWGGGRANASGIAAGGTVDFAYSTAVEPSDPAGTHSKTTITDRGGNVLELWHDGAGHRLRDRQVVDGEALLTEYRYNDHGLLTRITYPEGNRIEYRYDESAANRLARGNLLEMRRVADARRGCDGLGSTPCPDSVTTYTYAPNFQSVRSVTDARGNTTSYTYDDRGNLARVTFPSITIGPSAPQSASENWTYNPFGQPLSYADPDGHVTRYEYYGDGPATGYRQRVIRDDGHSNVITEYAYDRFGNVTSATDGRGVRTEFVYNALNQLVKITRAAEVPAGPSPTGGLVALGYETLFWYDANDNLVRVDAENVQPDLDASFHPTGTHHRDAVNPWWTTTYAYDLLDKLVRRTQEVASGSNTVVEYRYDPLERLIALTLPEGSRIEYAYDARDRVSQMTRGAGTREAVTTSYAYDGNGSLTRITDGEGHPTDFVYDGFDRITGQVDALGNVRHWRHDESGNLLEIIARDGQDGRNPARTLKAPGLVTLRQATFGYDERNRLYSSRRAFFSVDVGTAARTPITSDGDGDGWIDTTYTYDLTGNLVALTHDRGNSTRYSYDGLERLSTRTDALDNVTSFSYDEVGNLVQTTATERQPDGLAPVATFTTRYGYDAANRLVATTDNLGHTARYAYDGRDNLVFLSDANGRVAEGRNDHGNTALLGYDGLDRLVTETYHLRADGLGDGAVIGQLALTYRYDGNGNLIQSTDPKGNATTYAYDALDRLTQVSYSDGTVRSFAYDRRGNLVRQVDPTGSVIVHSYDATGRRIRTDVSRAVGVLGTTEQTFGWDGLGRLTFAADNNEPGATSDDSSVAFAHDSLGNVFREAQDGLTTVSTHDGLGNCLSLTYPGGKTLTFSYDALSRVKTIGDGTTLLATFDYIGPSRLLRRTNGNETYAGYTYDGLGQLTAIEYRRTSDRTLLMGFAYSYDRVGTLLTEIAQPSGVPSTYRYDSLYRLVAAHVPGATLEYAYDPAGNRAQVTRNGQVTSYSSNAVHQYLAVGGETRSYDANGNLRSIRRSEWPTARRLHLPALVRDSAFRGAVSTAADAVRRPQPAGVSVTVSDATGRQAQRAAAETAVTLAYDFANRLVAATEETSGLTVASADAKTMQWTYDALGRRTSFRSALGTVGYVYAHGHLIEDRSADAILATYVGALVMERGGSRVFYLTDRLGSVRALADAAGAVVERVDYDPFGAPAVIPAASGSSTRNPLLFRGRRYEVESGLYVFGGSRYDPVTGRFQQRAGWTMGNPYTFRGNSPVR